MNFKKIADTSFKLNNLHTLACLKLNYYITKRINQKCKGCKDGGIYQNLWPIPLLILVILSTP